MPCPEFSRRSILAGGGAVFVGALAPRLASAAGARDPRLITVVLRGALDGLSLVAPVGDPQYEAIRDGMAVARTGPNPGIPLDGFFALNPRLPTLAALYQKGEALFIHAAATPYRNRSHFDGQDVLESGLTNPGSRRSGWMNRLISELPDARAPGRTLGFAAGTKVPLIMRGEAKVLSWMPPGYASASADTKARLLDLYRNTDPGLASVLEAGLDLEALSGGEQELAASVENAMGATAGPSRLRQSRMAAIAAGKLIGASDGPRIGVLDLDGFDTHARQNPVDGALGNLLANLDGVIAGLAEALSAVWSDTVITFLTEFGRTVHVNGSAGTDHGTATVALLVGGAVAGGRVVADWPGLRPADLFEGRDLRPTTDLRAVLKGIAADHLGFPLTALDSAVFPDSAQHKPLAGLIRSS